jgi:hypothetical protein
LRKENSGSKEKEVLRDSDSLIAKIQPQYVQKQESAAMFDPAQLSGEKEINAESET